MPVTLNSPSGSFTPRKVTTDSGGAFSFAGVAAGMTYTVTPAKMGYTYTPTAKTLTNLSGNVAAGSLTNFTGVQ